MYCFCVVNDAWIVVVHTINVGPNLYLVSRESSTDERGCIVAATTLQVVYFAVSIAADESLCDIYLLALVLLHDVSEFLLDVLWVGFSVLVCAHEVECIEQNGLDALFLHVVYHHVGAHNLTLCHDAFLLKGSEEVFCERAQVIEFATEELAGGFLHLLSGVEIFHMLHVFFLQVVDYFVGSLWILLVEIVRDLNE